MGVREAISIHTYVYSESATTNERFVTRVTSAKVTRVSVASPKSVGGLCSRPVVIQYVQYGLGDVEEVPVCSRAKPVPQSGVRKAQMFKGPCLSRQSYNEL